MFLPTSGTHHHPPPQCVGASPTALRELATKTKENGGSWTALQLVAGLKGKHKKKVSVKPTQNLTTEYT
jgi:hypothetical protein